MDIQDIKEECNALIDEVLKLQEADKSLDLQIEALQEEINLLNNPQPGIPEEDKKLEAAENGTLNGEEAEGAGDWEKEDVPPETEEPGETSQTLAEQEAAAGGDTEKARDKESLENIPPARDSPGLTQDEENRLAGQMMLLSGKEARELVIVYEKSSGLQKARDLARTIGMILLMTAVSAAAVLLLYYGVERGVFF